MTAQGKVRYELENHSCEGIAHVIFEPLDFIAKLVALGGTSRKVWLQVIFRESIGKKTIDDA